MSILIPISSHIFGTDPYLSILELMYSTLSCMFSELNLCDEYMIGSKINFRDSFIYGIGKLIGIYAYEIYKENPKEFLFKFKTALLKYNNIGMEAFYEMGIDREELVDGKVLRRVLKESK